MRRIGVNHYMIGIRYRIEPRDVGVEDEGVTASCDGLLADAGVIELNH